MSMENSLITLENISSANTNFHHKNTEIIPQATDSNQHSEIKEHAVLFLMEKFYQAISKFYKDMGIGNNVDRKA